MSKKTYIWLSILILVVAFGLRFYQLGQVPHGMTWDEAAIGYNGMAIFTTRRDEWLVRLPVSFQSFGDYKAPLAIYLNGIFTAIFGMNLWAVRLPFALASIAAIWGMMILVKNLFNQRLSILAGSLMTLSPWHLHYSRAGFESGLALMGLIWGLVGWVMYRQKQTWYWLSFSILSMVAATYTYHSAKLVIPLLMVYLIAISFKKLWHNKKTTIFAGAIGLVAWIPLIKDSLFGEGLTRANTTLFSDLSGWAAIKLLITNFFAHLSPAFLVMGETTSFRHGDGRWGVLFVTTLILVILGLIKGFRTKSDSAWQLAILLVLIGILPAALGTEIPHSNRALLALPGFILLAVYGWQYLLEIVKKSELNKKLSGTHGETDILIKIVMAGFVLIHGLLFTKYLHNYYGEFAAESASDFKDGYLAAFSKVVPLESKVEKILFTSDYGQPYIYALFVRQTNPIWYRGGSLIKYEFTDQISAADLLRKNTIVVGSNQDELEPNLAEEIILGSDNMPKFLIYYPQDETL